ncbi:hypothetical protein L0657_06005 [Dyadobacter sp. CY345]|uniref:hypothetical protein n=1 Tax=Dyadobacter sp. CY345 TaxID=2909335 RepID=UPI001F44936E|nr:hypothetical protein [Dyadobacter sp. CY345]MCF2443505.1 hypothetical protein [Dyadobacter sp. CY345]
MKKYILTALTITFLYGCNSANDKKNEHQEHTHHDSDIPVSDQTQEMLAIHDSIMPHMDKLMDYKKQISVDMKKTDSLMAIKSSDALKARKEEAQKLHAELDSADKAMMGWMHGLKLDTLKLLDKTQAEAYVADQKTKIENVKVLMTKSLKDASDFIDNN